MELPEKLINMIEAEGFTVSQADENVYEFSKFSPADHDFSFCVDAEDDLELFRDNIIELHQSFDPSYEAYLWLDDTGHGKNGAPYDMKDVYEDMEACQEYIYDLQAIVGKYLCNS